MIISVVFDSMNGRVNRMDEEAGAVKGDAINSRSIAETLPDEVMEKAMDRNEQNNGHCPRSQRE